MPAMVLTEFPVIKGIEAILDGPGGSKFTLRIRTRAYVGSTPVNVTFDVPGLDLAPWDGTWWATSYDAAVQGAYSTWGYDLP